MRLISFVVRKRVDRLRNEGNVVDLGAGVIRT
jgi:hypothetical protein